MPQPLLRVRASLDLTWHYAAGSHFTRFFEALRDDGLILALRCPACRRVYLPPRPVCGNCFRRMEEWVPVGPQGTLRAFTVVHFPFLDPTTGQPRPVPFGMGLIQLDGADTTLNHFLRMPEATQPPLALGARVRAVWRADRRGAIDDIVHFEVMP